MSDEDKDKIVKEDEVKVDENQSKDENKPSETESSDNIEKKIDNNELTQSESESSTNKVEETQSSAQTDQETPKKEETKKEHEVFHKKDGRLHIYVRQDKYKGELKSKNWVGRLYIDGKQKISSSGTPNLEEAIPILEKWFDDVHKNKDKEEQISKETVETPVTTEEQPAVTAEPTTPPTIETPKPSETASVKEKAPEPAPTQTVSASVEDKEASETKTPSSFLDKLKNIKLKKPSFASGVKTPKISALGKGGFKSKLDSFFKSKLGKSTAQGEEILGVEITNKEIRLAQISSNKANQWVLEKFFVHKVDLPDDAAVLENSERLGGELSIAIQKSKITTPNAAIAIPVTSAIIRVVTAPLMKEEELQKAIETNSLWENLVQLTDNLDDYSIFHQVINRNATENTMDILFVASKLADINSYTDIIKKGGLNAVIIDVKCFALKSAVDQINQISGSIEESNLTAVLEFGLDENYVMILYENNPIITDIFIRSQDRNTLQNSDNQEEMDALVRRYVTQVKQAVQDFETKYEKRIRNLKVVSNLENVETYLGTFRKNLTNTGFNLLDPIKEIKVPAQLEESVKLDNRSYLSTVIGLAFRKLDVFGYYKFVTAVKNINLLPNRDSMIAQKKAKVFSNFAFKGAIGVIAIIYIVLFGLSFWQINTLNKQLVGYDDILQIHELRTLEKNKVEKELALILKSLKISKSIKSNKKVSFRVLAQIASAVPKRVKFNSIEYNGSNQIIIQGTASSDQDILKLISNLNNKKLIMQAQLATMTLPDGQTAGAPTMKGFKIACILENA